MTYMVTSSIIQNWVFVNHESDSSSETVFDLEALSHKVSKKNIQRYDMSYVKLCNNWMVREMVM